MFRDHQRPGQYLSTSRRIPPSGWATLTAVTAACYVANGFQWLGKLNDTSGGTRDAHLAFAGIAFPRGTRSSGGKG